MNKEIILKVYFNIKKMFLHKLSLQYFFNTYNHICNRDGKGILMHQTYTTQLNPSLFSSGQKKKKR
jgi:hypothetical protein